MRLAALLGFLFTIACAHTPRPLSDAEIVQRARGIHERVITLDTHVDFRLSNFTPERNYSTEQSSQVDLVKMQSGGLNVAWLVVFTSQGELNPAGYAAAHQHALQMFDAIHRLCDEFAPDQVELALNSKDVRRIHASGKLAVMIAIENGYPVGLDLANIQRFHELGGRYMSLAHNGHSQFSDSHTGEADDSWLHGGLSDLGRQALGELNKWGIIVDISHPSRAAIHEMLMLSKAPVVASHSSARALNDVSRNLDDEQLQGVRKNGGVVQTVAFRSYVNADKDRVHRDALRGATDRVAEELGFERLGREALGKLDPQARAAYDAELARFRELCIPAQLEAERGAPPVDVADFVDHIDYLVECIGIEHVGISSDFDGGGGVRGWNDASETFNVTLELVRRGYSEAEIEKLWSGNLLRVLDEVERVAQELQAKD